MGTIEEIIQAIDDELIETGKDYLSLGQANQLLESQNIITFSEKSNKTLKKLLENNKIPHAYQTENAPRQWRIPLSKKEIHRKNTIPRKRNPKSGNTDQNLYQSPSQNINFTNCPGCGISLFVPDEIINEAYIQCLNCGREFKNPFRNKHYASGNHKMTRATRNWIIGIAVVIILFVIGNFSESDSSSPSNLYYVNATTYVATSKAYFDEMFRYINDKDEQALSSLMLYGQIKPLARGSEVYLVSAHFGYCIVRQPGMTQNLWIVTGHISQK